MGKRRIDTMAGTPQWGVSVPCIRRVSASPPQASPYFFERSEKKFFRGLKRFCWAGCIQVLYTDQGPGKISLNVDHDYGSRSGGTVVMVNASRGTILAINKKGNNRYG